MLKLRKPLAIAMWDFSWLERRWPGAGFEDWDIALDELAERGYDAVRIDAYPHLVAWGREELWELLPAWHFLDWGAPTRTDVRVMPSLTAFIAKCRDRNIKVALSTWFREDAKNVRMRIADASIHAEIWIETITAIEQAGLLDTILYLDFCNEWPGDKWAPFFKNDPTSDTGYRAWMEEALARTKQEFPLLPMTFSFWPDTKVKDPSCYAFLDLLEPHLWLATQYDFARHIQYGHQPFDVAGIEAVARNAEAVYRAGKLVWDSRLLQIIDAHAELSRRCGRGLITTECWGPVDYKDGSRMDWGWVKEACTIGTERAAASGRWLAIATSNFCSPQFVGMWRDVAWHKRLTNIIKTSQLDDDLIAVET